MAPHELSKHAARAVEMLYKMKRPHNPALVAEAVGLVERAVLCGSIGSEKSAMDIIMLTAPGIEPWEATSLVTEILPKFARETISIREIPHPWFGTVKVTVFEDVWGRVWSRSVGTLRDGFRMIFVGGKWTLDTVGGLSWESTDQNIFTCECRTSREEVNAACRSQ